MGQTPRNPNDVRRTVGKDFIVPELPFILTRRLFADLHGSALALLLVGHLELATDRTRLDFLGQLRVDLLRIRFHRGAGDELDDEFVGPSRVVG